MKRPEFLRLPLRVLWFAMATSIAVLSVVLVYRLAPLLPGRGESLSEIRPIGQPEIFASGLPPAAVASRNPFDPGGTHWSKPSGPADGTGTGAIKGVILLPGARAVLTEGRAVKFGDVLGGGKLLGVEGQQLLIETTEGAKRIDLPGANRPHLKDLNRRSSE